MNVEKFVVGALSIFLASALVSVSAAQSNESGLTRFDKDTGIPDDVMLPKFVKMIAEYADDKPEIDGLKYGVRLIQTRLSLQSYEEAELLLNYFVQVDEEISRSKSQFFRDTVCPLDVPRPEGPSVFEKMNAANANIDRLGQQYLVSIESEIGTPRFELFLEWMHDRKQNTLIIRNDYAQYYEGRDPNAVRQEVCGRFDDAMSRSHLRGVQ